MDTIATRIKAIRKLHKLNQQSFADILSLSQTHISKIEAGKDNASDKLLRLISVEFCINYQWLKTGVGEMHSVARNNIPTAQESVMQLSHYLKTCSEVERLFCSTHVFRVPTLFQSANFLDSSKYATFHEQKMHILMTINNLLNDVCDLVEYLNDETKKVPSKNIHAKIEEIFLIADTYEEKMIQNIDLLKNAYLGAGEIDKENE